MGLGLFLLAVAIYGFTRVMGTASEAERLELPEKWVDNQQQYQDWLVSEVRSVWAEDKPVTYTVRI